MHIKMLAVQIACWYNFTMKFTKVLNNKYALMTLSVMACVAYSMIVFAAPPTNQYNPGESLNPSCAPGTINCAVAVPWLTDSTNGYVYNTTQKIGIGTATPAATLDVVGDFSQIFAHAGGQLLSGIGNSDNLFGMGTVGSGMVTFDTNNNYGAGFITGNTGDGEGNETSMLMFDMTGTKSITAKTLWNSGDPIFEILGQNAGTNNFGIMDVGAGSVAFQAFHPGKYRSYFSSSATATGLYSNFANISTSDGFQTALQSKFDDGNPSARGIGIGTTHDNTDPHSAGNTVSVDDTGIQLLMTPDILGTFSSGITLKNDTSGIVITGNDSLSTSINTKWYSSTTNLMQLNNDGRLAIGSAASSTDLVTVAGDIRVGTSLTNGCLKDYSGGTIIGTCSSDERLKTNIESVTNVLDGFTRLNVVTYQWNDIAQAKGFHGGVPQMGVLAQNVRDVFPDLVTTDSTGYYQVNYARLPLLTIEAVKELNVKLDAIQNFSELVNGTFLSNLKSWLGDSANGLARIIAGSVEGDTIKANNQLCVGTVCISQDQFLKMVQMSASVPDVNNGVSVPSTDTHDVSSTPTTTVVITDTSSTTTDAGGTVGDTSSVSTTTEVTVVDSTTSDPTTTE